MTGSCGPRVGAGRPFGLPPDLLWLFASRAARLFGSGVLSVTLGLYLARLGLRPAVIGAVLAGGLLGAALATAGLATLAHRWGRRRSLVSAAALSVLGAVLLLTQSTPLALGLAAAVGSVSASGQDVGPQQALEQAGLADLVEGGRRRADLFAWYSLAGSLAAALGALVAGLPGLLGGGGSGVGLAAERGLVGVYAACAVLGLAAYTRLSTGVDGPPAGAGPAAAAARPLRPPSLWAWTGLHRSRRTVAQLAGLFALDSFAGGVAVQGLVAFDLHLRFGLGLGALGPIFFATNVTAALSYLVAARLARRFGLLNTMVFTHLPSNVLLMAVAAAPVWPLAVVLLVARSGLSQMDVPTRQAYTMALVDPSERSAAAGATGAARTLGAMAGPLVGGAAVALPQLGLIFLIGGGLKVVYDVTLFRVFRRVPVPVEAPPAG
ncbi:MAG TPA: MFS transporter [Candidatus Micrarchaeia archaeon]|nr:MFS transporter [Candidatus Micrarchaeia archaeon]